MIFRIFHPETISFQFWDEYGERYDVPPEGSTVIDRPMTEVEALNNLRIHRDTLLTDCDWTQLPDVPLSPDEVEAWRLYRQQLRDLPEGMQWNVTTWPPKP